MLLFVLVVAAFGVGVIGCVRLARGWELCPAGVRAWAARASRRRGFGGGRLLGLAVVVTVLVLAVTRWPVAAVLAGALVALWPRLAGGGAVERRAVAKIEAVAAWTESLRDTAAAASGLEYAIPATLDSAPPLLERPLRALTYRLAARVPLPQALTLFAEEVDDAAADIVVAALSLNARQRAGGLSRVLTALAANTRAELEIRRKVLLERNAVRRQSQQVAVLGLLLAVGQAVLAPDWFAPYGTPVGQGVLAVLVGAYLALAVRLRRLADPEPQPRFLGRADAVLEMASFGPRVGAGTGGSR
jgi:tight adherence protein B